jgi:hypothetical protein
MLTFSTMRTNNFSKFGYLSSFTFLNLQTSTYFYLSKLTFLQNGFFFQNLPKSVKCRPLL